MSPASTESNGLMRERSCSSQGLVLQKVSLVCTACGPFLCSDCSVLQACCRQRLSLPSMGSIWSLARVWWILTGCALVCLWNETWHQLYQNWSPAELSGLETWCGQFLCWFLAEGPAMLGLRQYWLRRATVAEHRGMGFGVNKLGSQCPCSATFIRWVCLCWRVEEENGILYCS